MDHLATFFGEYGNRCAEVAVLASAITTPIFVVDFFEIGNIQKLTKFFDNQADAEEAGILYAFEGKMNE
jgi:hypothetical protein